MRWLAHGGLDSKFGANISDHMMVVGTWNNSGERRGERGERRDQRPGTVSTSESEHRATQKKSKRATHSAQARSRQRACGGLAGQVLVYLLKKSQVYVYASSQVRLRTTYYTTTITTTTPTTTPMRDASYTFPAPALRVDVRTSILYPTSLYDMIASCVDVARY